MADKIKLPPLPIGEDCYEVMSWGDIRARDLEVARVVLEAAAKTSDSLAGYVDQWSEQVEFAERRKAKEIADAIRALEIDHE